VAHTESYLDITSEQHPGGIVVLRVREAIDAMNAVAFDNYLYGKIPTATAHVIVDLTEVTQLSSAGVRVLLDHTKLRSLSVVATAAHVREVLQVTAAIDDLNVYDSLGEAMASRQASAQDAELRQEIFGLRAALRTRPMIARALGVLQGRYRMSDVDRPFQLLRESAQRYNLKLHTLAGALLAAPAPRPSQEWFPGRMRRPAPPLSFQPYDRQHNRTAVLAAFLEHAIEIMGTSAGDLQLVDAPGHILRLEQHRGLPPEFVDYFAVVEDPSTSCAVALRGKSRVVVTDVAADPLFAGTEPGRMVLAAGVRSVQSTPLLTPDGRCIGITSTHDSRPGQAPTGTQATQLDQGAKEVATWLDWHQRTVVLDALEYIHQQATGA
jgi:anti-anti-sigma factor